MNTSNETIDTSRCPLCQQANNCARNNIAPAQRCWCQQAHFGVGLLSQLPADLRGKSCICKTCADKAAALASAIE